VPPPRASRSVPDFSDLSSAEDDEQSADLSEGGIPEPPNRGARRLPDIEEINSTLRASADRGRDPAARGTPQTRAENRSGFRTGFLSVLLLVSALVALYALAPQIATAVPALMPFLDSYVVLADTGRMWLDDMLRMVILQLQPAG
ncbi:hypothetical protein CKO11_16065, partial [Rhodobacter sp. TJ_12]|nr:hypothetical protein [Rhodobacter sp. TJ_12]